MYVASCGIDAQTIQLHGRSGSRAVLRYVRLSPLAQSLSLVASLGKDLQAVQKQILAASASLAQLQAPCSFSEIQTHYQHPLGTQLSSAAGVLGRPSVREVLERPDGRWFRNPSHNEVLVINELSVKAHSLCPPSCPPDGTDLACLREDLACAKAPTWCGWSFARVTSTSLRRWGSDVVASQVSLCTRCFGTHSAASSSSSSSSESWRSGAPWFSLSQCRSHHLPQSPPFAVARTYY